MISARAQRASQSATAPALKQRSRGVSTGTVSARARSSAAAPGRTLGTIERQQPSVMPSPSIHSIPKCTTSSHHVRHRSFWSHDGQGNRAKHSWHSSGCTWVNSESDPKTTARDNDCPACQAEAKEPFEYSSGELLHQRHREQMDAFRHHIEKDPYDALFGWSNRRLNALWNRSSFAALKSEMDALFPGRAALHSHAPLQTASDGGGRKIPIQTDSGAKDSTSAKPMAGDPSFQATMSWRTSTTDPSGQTHEASGDLVYDPVSNRMVPRDEWMDKASPTAIGKGIDAQAVGEEDTSDSKYARPSSDAMPEPLSSPKVDADLEARVDEIKQKEADYEQAKEQAQSAVGVKEDARRAGWATSKTPSTPPPTDFPVNAEQAPMQNIVYSGQHMSDKYVTPSEDPVSAPKEKLSVEEQSAMRRIEEKEAQLQQAKENAASSVGVEEDAQRVGWTNKDLKPERPVSAIPIARRLGQTPRLESSLDRHTAKAHNSRLEENASPPSATETMSQAETTAMEKVKAREHGINLMRKRLDQKYARVKQDMEQSWKRAIDSPPHTSSKASDSATSSQSITDAQTMQQNAWSQFKSGSIKSSTGQIQAASNTIAEDLTYSQKPLREYAIGDEPIYSVANHGRFDAKPSLDNANVGTVVSPVPNATSHSRASVSESRDSPATKTAPVSPLRKAGSEQGLRDDKRALLSAMRKEKTPSKLRSINFAQLNGHRERLRKEFSERLESRTAASKADEWLNRKMKSEVSNFKTAMNAFEMQQHSRPSANEHSLQGTKERQPASTQPQHAEMMHGEGDMSPQVVGFAENGRWYKDKAPHAKLSRDELEIKDRQLIQELRQAYESTYGKITEDHRQGKLPTEINARRKVGFEPRSTSDLSEPPTADRAKPDTHPVNPIDGTSLPNPNLTPQTGNFASPTSFVNHDQPSDGMQMDPGAETTQPDTAAIQPRRVHREEPVFSGQVSAQRYTIPEVVEMLKGQKINQTSEGGAGASSKGKHRSNGAPRPSKSRIESSGIGQGIKYGLAGGAISAALCYAIGIMVEYAREPRIEGGYDQGRPTWDGQRSWRGRQVTTEQPSRSVSPSADVRKKGLGLGDMPLGGVEFPMMALLVACIWHILSSGGS